MAYSPYYNGGWKSGEVGGTPITPEALNHMENGIQAALTSESIVNNLSSGETRPVSSGGVYSALVGEEWVAVPALSDNFTAGTVRYKKIGNVLYVTADSLSTSKTGSVTVITLPNGYKPAYRWTVKPAYPNLSGDSYINFATDGQIQLINFTGSAVANVFFATSFPTV